MTNAIQCLAGAREIEYGEEHNYAISAIFGMLPSTWRHMLPGV
jgi:hypothetical protein